MKQILIEPELIDRIGKSSIKGISQRQAVVNVLEGYLSLKDHTGSSLRHYFTEQELRILCYAQKDAELSKNLQASELIYSAFIKDAIAIHFMNEVFKKVPDTLFEKIKKSTPAEIYFLQELIREAWVGDTIEQFIHDYKS